ncbi:hypothetical protein GCT13_05240 [Paraburkholderia sp. CNPSo 3157]|uniref:Uncharacterized protein n=1 Tax=Paraburkholderia franconis TaxID=2654983 RepID=A0A7X1TEH0_9BURK|nr:hypothetical protein [Paraburkholderia franconis]MPW16350.1 hypothetical protein [Paraburkholderia franconis]
MLRRTAMLAALVADAIRLCHDDSTGDAPARLRRSVRTARAARQRALCLPVVYDARGVFEFEGITRERALSLKNQQVKVRGTITRVNNADAQHVRLPAVRVESTDIVQSPDATSSSAASPAR